MFMTIAAAIEAVGADPTLRKTDTLNQILQFGELQCGESQALGNLCHHTLIFRRIGLCILLEILLVVALEILDDTTGNQLHITLGRGEADERTAIDQRRTRDAAVNLLGTILEKGSHVILQLGTTYDGVVAEHHALILQQSRVWNQLHLCHQSTALLISRCERAGPCGSVLGNCSYIGTFVTLSITYSHTQTAVGNTAGAIDLDIIALFIGQCYTALESMRNRR